MKTIKDILQSIAHRPWPLPEAGWSYYQEWNKALFLHWKVPADELEKILPPHLTIDHYQGEAWISIVAFTMQGIRPKHLPSWSFLSDFHEINVRTYVCRDQKPGVYFINIEAEKLLAAWTARNLSGLPYEKAMITRKANNLHHQYKSNNIQKGFQLIASFSVMDPVKEKSGLEKWLTERYCLYLDRGKEIYRFETHHDEWALNNVQLHQLETAYRVGNIELTSPPDLVHYSEGVKVISWKKEKVF